jgi:tetratricopeptide (TPR) repeat protein
MSLGGREIREMNNDDKKPSRAPRYRIAQPPPQPLPDHSILGDLDEPLARVLWRGLRDVREWGVATPTQRGELFSQPGAEFREAMLFASVQAPALADAIGTLASLRTSPRVITTRDLVEACVTVRDWADNRGLVVTALAYAEAAAGLDLDNPILACDAGKAARRAAFADHAESWFDRAIKLAARLKNRREQIRALLGLGALMREIGRFQEAREFIGRASNMAASTRRNRQAAESSHDLLAIAIEDGSYDECEAYVLDALRTYPIHHPSIPRLVHDWAFYLVRRSLYCEAVPLLVAIVPTARRPELKMLYQGTLARAAAGAGRRRLYDESVRGVVALSGVHQEFAAAALANSAEGARFFHEWDRAEGYAARAVEIASERAEVDVQRGALEILDAIATREAAEPQALPPAGSRVEAITGQVMALMHQRQKPPRRPVETDRDTDQGAGEAPKDAHPS